MKLRYERGALVDLEEVFSYIASDNREAAARLVARFERSQAWSHWKFLFAVVLDAHSESYAIQCGVI
jgi:hypothetical protein